MRTNLPRTAVDYAAYVAVRLFVCVVQSLRLETCTHLAGLLATLCSRVLKLRHAVLEDNLRHAFPEMSDCGRAALVWRMWEHLFLMLFEIMHAPRKIHDTNWRDYIDLKRAEVLVSAFFDDRPTVVICGHFGNFELSGYVLGVLGFQSFTIARPLDNRFLDRYLNEFRSKTGQYILPKSGSSGDIAKVLERGGIVALLGDQHAGPKGCWVDFFGRPASSHKAIALFTLGSGALTVFCSTQRTRGPLTAVLHTHELLDPRTAPNDMLSVPAITAWYTRQLEETIRGAPEQYWWVHRRWKDTRPKKQAVVHERAA